jgi:hypothetical protein
LSAALGAVPLIAQDNKDMPNKSEMPMKGDGMKEGGMMMGNMKETHSKMMEMKKAMGGMMRARDDEERRNQGHGTWKRQDEAGTNVGDVEDDGRYVRHDKQMSERCRAECKRPGIQVLNWRPEMTTRAI